MSYWSSHRRCWVSPCDPHGPWKHAEWKCWVMERLGFQNDIQMQEFQAHLGQEGILLCEWWKAWSAEDWQEYKNEWSPKQWQDWFEDWQEYKNEWSPKQWQDWFDSLRKESTLE